MLRLLPVACWHEVHVVLYGDNDDFHNEDYDDIMMTINKVMAIYSNDDDKDDNEENDDSCLLASGARCPRQ